MSDANVKVNESAKQVQMKKTVSQFMVHKIRLLSKFALL